MENPSTPSLHFSQEGVLSLYRGSRNDGRLERSAASLKTPRSRGGNTNASFFKESHVTGGAGGSGPRPLHEAVLALDLVSAATGSSCVEAGDRASP